MDFSEAYKSSGAAPLFSPDGKYIATVIDYRLVIRAADSMNVVQLYSCLDKIHKIEWSPNSVYVLCGLYDRAVVQVWSAEDADWTCKIDEGPAGISSVRWSPDGCSLVCVADFCIRASIWSLVDRACETIARPKFADRGISFSPDGSMMAMLHRQDLKDFICLYRTSDWSREAGFPTESQDLQDIAYSPDGRFIAAWDSSLTYRLLVYTESGQCVANYSAYSDALGIRSVCWSPPGDMISIGSYDQRLRVLNGVTWQPLLECQHAPQVASPSATVYREVEEPQGVLNPIQASQSRSTTAMFVLESPPVTLPANKPPTDKPNPKLGIATHGWSPSGQYVMSVNDNMPNAVWLWDASTSELTAVLLMADPVKAAKWAPTGCTLAICTGTTRLYMWTPAGASIVHIPLQNFCAHGVQWDSAGSAFALSDKEAFCCAYLAAPESVF